MSGAAAAGIVERDSYSGKQEDVDGAGGQVLGAMLCGGRRLFIPYLTYKKSP